MFLVPKIWNWNSSLSQTLIPFGLQTIKINGYNHFNLIELIFLDLLHGVSSIHLSGVKTVQTTQTILKCIWHVRQIRCSWIKRTISIHLVQC